MVSENVRRAAQRRVNKRKTAELVRELERILRARARKVKQVKPKRVRRAAGQTMFRLVGGE